MAQLILIKHARPEVVPGVPPERWRLSESGRASCPALCQRLRPWLPFALFTSHEPKAVETGDLLAGPLGLTPQALPGLGEHDRSNVPHMQSREFIAAVALFFQRPNQLALGRETADQALARFSSAVHSALAAAPDGNVAIVTHGTVLSLFVAAHNKEDPFRLWRALQLPALVVLDLPSLRLQETVATI